MASNQPAYAPAPPDGEAVGEWDEFPAAVPGSPDHPDSPESAAYGAALRGVHRLPRQRNTARSSTVLGIAAMAAVGTGGVAVAAAPGAAPAPGSAPIPISAPDTPAFDFFADDPSAHSAPGAPQAAQAADEAGTRDRTTPAGHPEPSAGYAEPAAQPDPSDPGEALRTRILGQATAQREAAAQAEREAAERVAAKEAAARKVREQAAAAKAAAEAKAKADAEAAAEAEAERLAQLARSYIKPLASSTLTAGYGEADPWANLHTGQDFTAPTGTPVHAIHTGTVSSAGWAGAYGYRVVLSLEDGTELWYCHLSTMVVTSGQVTTGDTIGRVGATGNVPAPHLHLEVRPGGGDPIDPLPWLRTHDVPV